MVNERQAKLMQKLLLQPEIYSRIETLAEELDCSEKTIRNDLKITDQFLQERSHGELIRKPGLGVTVSISEEEKHHIFSRLHKKASHGEQDRLLEIGYRLLVEENSETIQGLAENFFVSVKEIKQDVAVIADWLATFDIVVISRQKRGLIVDGDEWKKRSALAHLSELVQKEDESSEQIIRLFPQHEVNFIRKCIIDLLGKWDWKISAEKQESLIIHALIMIKRVRQSSTLLMRGNEQRTTKNAEESEMTEELAQLINETLALTLPESEKVYFTLHLMSCSAGYSLRGNPDMEGLADGIIQHLTTQLQILTMTNFKEDSILLEGLNVHLPSTIHRVIHDLAIRNPMLEEIKKMYPYMFSMVVIALDEVNATYDIRIPEDEAAYLVLHFQASIERLQKKRDEKKKVVIVCELGVGMSHLLQAKLEQSYKGMEVLGCVGVHEIDSLLAEYKVDFILSTRELEERHVPVLVISPLLRAEDRKRLDEFLQEEDKQPLYSNMIPEWLEKGEVELGIESLHPYELIEKLGRKLERRNMVSEQFTKKAILRERTSSTSLGNGIAIPHAPPEEINESSVSLAIFNHPVEWGQEQVSIVFLLAISKKDQGNIRSLMHMITRMGDDPEVIGRLQQARSLEEVENVLK